MHRVGGFTSRCQQQDMCHVTSSIIYYPFSADPGAQVAFGVNGNFTWITK